MTSVEAPLRQHHVNWAVEDGFIAALERSGASLVMTTRPDLLFLLSAESGSLQGYAVQFERAFGLAVAPGRFAVASERAITVYVDVPQLAPHYPTKPGQFDACFVPRTVHFTGPCDMHDMVFTSTGIVGTNTTFSCICLIDGTFSFQPLWHPAFITKLAAEDRCHVNGFAVADGEIRFVTALSMSDEPGGWRRLPANAGVLIEARTKAVLRSDLCMPHSPRIIDGDLYLLNGGEGEVHRIHADTGASTILARLPGFTHGLCSHGGIMFVGLSQNRVSRSADPPPVVQRHPSVLAGLAALDVRSGALLGRLEFTQGISEVYDIQALPGVRRPMVQDATDMDDYVAVDTPHAQFWTKKFEPKRARTREPE